MLLDQAADLRSRVALWESITLVTTIASAVFISVSSLFGLAAYYRKKRPHNQTLTRLDRKIGWEKSSLSLAAVASACALAGALSSIWFTIASHQQQDYAEHENQGLHIGLARAQEQSAAASRIAISAASDLTKTTQKLTQVTTELMRADQQLASAKKRLEWIDVEQKHRWLRNEQIAAITALVSNWKGDEITIHPIADDPEAFFFAQQVDLGFRNAGWATKWAGFSDIATSNSSEVKQGLELVLPTKDEGVGEDLKKALTEAAKIADPDAQVYGPSPDFRGFQLFVGKKRSPHAPKAPQMVTVTVY